MATDYNMADVYARRNDLRALGYAVKAGDQQSKVALSSMLPNLALIGAYEFSNPNMFNGFKKRFAGQFSVGAMLTIPIWHWGGNYNKYRAAKSQALVRRLRLEDAREMVDLQVKQSAFRAREALKTRIMTESNIAKADENLRQARLAFREGMMTPEQVMEARDSLAQSRQRECRRSHRRDALRHLSFQGSRYPQLLIVLLLPNLQRFPISIVNSFYSTHTAMSDNMQPTTQAQYPTQNPGSEKKSRAPYP